jgi:cellulose synthase (UDP-forming)
MCRAYGARYVSRAIRHEERPGSLNHALTLMQRETAAGPVDDVDLIAVIDAGDVPLPTLLTATLGWFADPEVASVQARRTRGAGAWDDVVADAPAAGSGSLFRTHALREIGGVATDGDPRSTVHALARAGWRTELHDQAVVIDRAPATPATYLADQHRRMAAAQRLGGVRGAAVGLGALQGALSLLALLVPAALLVSGAETSTAAPLSFALVFAGALAVRAWGTRRLTRTPLTAADLLARRVAQVSVGLSCARRLLTRKAPRPHVDDALRAVAVVATALVALLGYAVAGTAGAVPWRASVSSTIASGAWLLVALVALGVGALRLRSADLALRRTDSRRFRIAGRATVDGFDVDLVDVGIDGATVGLPLHDWPGNGTVQLALPGTETVTLALLPETGAGRLRTLRALPGDWQALRTLSLWLFHVHPGAAGRAVSSTPTQLKMVMHP